MQHGTTPSVKVGPRAPCGGTGAYVLILKVSSPKVGCQNTSGNLLFSFFVILAFWRTYFYWGLLQRGPTFNDGVVHWSVAFNECPQIRLRYGSPQYMFGRRKKGGDLMIGCAIHGKGHLTFCENTCNVEGREEQHDPMIMQWRFTSEATKSCFPPSGPRLSFASGAQDHAIKEADPQPPLRRVAVDGNSYTETEFANWYGPGYRDTWDQASASHEETVDSQAPPTALVAASAAFHKEHDSTSKGVQERQPEIESEADEDQMSQDSKDEIISIGFFLAKSLALLPEFI